MILNAIKNFIKNILPKKRILKQKDSDWEAFIDLNLKAAEEIRKELKIDDESFLFVHGQSWADTRSYVIYTALDEVQKMAFYLTRMRELLEDAKVDPRSERLQRLISEEITEDQQSKIRRLLEILIVLILFEKTNETEYYRHFIQMEELQGLLFSNMDLKEFYAEESANINDTIENQKLWISNVESKLKLENCWYLKKRVKILEQNLKSGLLSTMRQRIIQGLPLMTSLEKILFGYSYKGTFSVASESLHYTVLQNVILSGEKELSLHRFLGILGFSIIKRVSNLMGNPSFPNLRLIINSLKETSPDDLIFSQTVRNIKVGDFVLAYGDLAEVMEIKDSTYGYRSYHILYLAEKPKPEIQEDWFPAKYIQRIFDGADIRNKVIKKITAGADIDETKLSNLDWQKILRKSVLETWRLGLKDYLKKK